jgi:hypothetical protein
VSITQRKSRIEAVDDLAIFPVDRQKMSVTELDVLERTNLHFVFELEIQEIGALACLGHFKKA